MEKIDKFRSMLEHHFIIEVCTDPHENPLYLATENDNVCDDLLKCPGPLAMVNKTQDRLIFNEEGLRSFIVLTSIIHKSNFITRYKE